MIGTSAIMNLFGLLLSDNEEAEDSTVPVVRFSVLKKSIDEMAAAGVKDCKVSLNTPGGDMITGFASYDTMKSSSVKFSIKVVGMCASMGTVLMLAGEGLPEAEPNALFMFHRPKGGGYGESDKLRERADLIDKLEARAAKLYMEAFGIDEDAAKALMKPNVDKWMTAEEMLASGFISGITGNAPGAKVAKPKAGMSAQMVFTQSIQINKSDTMKLPKATLEALSLANFANAELTSEQIESAVTALAGQRDSYKEKYEKLEAKSREDLSARATAMVKAATLAKKITAAEEAEYIKAATENDGAGFAFVEKALSKMQGPTMPSAGIKPGEESTGAVKLTAEQQAMGLRELEKKFPKVLLQMKKEAPEMYAELYEKQYGTKPKS